MERSSPIELKIEAGLSLTSIEELEDNNNNTLLVCTLHFEGDPPAPKEEGKRHKQWFHFHVLDARKNCRFVIENADEAHCKNSFRNYSVFVGRSSRFTRIPTTYDGKQLIFDYEVDLTHNASTFAYFEPYPYEKHLSLIQKMSSQEHCKVETLGKSLEGRPIYVLNVSSGDSSSNTKKHIWITCRQHPAETQAEWWCEGFLSKLFNENNRVSQELISQCNLHIVPCMNPDGVFHQYTLTNSIGYNLNREWGNPSITCSPEVLSVLNEMEKSGVDCFIDVHADEELETGAIFCCTPAWTQRLMNLQNLFCKFYKNSAGILFDDKLSSTFLLPELKINNNSESRRMDAMQSEGTNLSLASTQIGYKFDCLSVTIEQPYKNLVDNWSSSSSMKLGSMIVQPLLEILPHLRV